MPFAAALEHFASHVPHDLIDKLPAQCTRPSAELSRWQFGGGPSISHDMENMRRCLQFHGCSRDGSEIVTRWQRLLKRLCGWEKRWSIMTREQFQQGYNDCMDEGGEFASFLRGLIERLNRKRPKRVAGKTSIDEATAYIDHHDGCTNAELARGIKRAYTTVKSSRFAAALKLREYWNKGEGRGGWHSPKVVKVAR